MKARELIGKGIIILEKKDYCFEQKGNESYDRTHFIRGITGHSRGIVVDILHDGQRANIVVQSGGLLWEFTEDELLYEGELVGDLIKEWDLRKCPTLLPKEEECKWGV